jgi:SAM-dependent methyltransferase
VRSGCGDYVASFEESSTSVKRVALPAETPRCKTARIARVQPRLEKLFRKFLGNPFVYDQVRTRVVGGIDMGRFYALLEPEARSSILDVGCGTGDALRHVTGFEHYLGVDTDEIALETARGRYGERPGVRFERRELRAADVAELAPTGVVLSGLLHHLSNDVAAGVLRMTSGSPSLRRVITCDIVFLPGMLFNNTMAMLDRGRFCRDPDAYAALARGAGLEVEQSFLMPSSPTSDRVQYWIMSLRPKSARS